MYVPLPNVSEVNTVVNFSSTSSSSAVREEREGGEEREEGREGGRREEKKKRKRVMLVYEERDLTMAILNLKVRFTYNPMSGVVFKERRKRIRKK